MAANKPPGVKITGIRGSIPAGYMLGRVSSGHGDVELLSLQKLQSAGLAPTTLPGPPTGGAGGDLSGTYPNPSVVGLQGRAVSVSAPVNLDVLLYHTAGATWLPAPLGTVAYTNNYVDLTGVPPAGSYLPAGGSTGQVLAKNSAVNYDVSWVAAGTGGGGGGAASIQDDGTNIYLAISDTDGQLVLDGSGDPVFMLEVFPASAIPTPAAHTAPTYTTLLTVTTGNYTPPVGCVRIEYEMKAGGSGSTGQGAGATGGAAGADASFNSITAKGASASTTGGAGVPGAGGTGGTGTIGVYQRIPGQSGWMPGNMPWDATTFVILGGHGGGVGAPSGQNAPFQNGVAAPANSGAGASGANTINTSPAGLAALPWSPGGGEGELVRGFINNPVGPYAWVVPDGGVGGTGATIGAKGGSGYIIIKEIYYV